MRFVITAIVATVFVLPALADAPAGHPGIMDEQPTAGTSVKVTDGFMVPYVVTIPGTEVTFEMLPIPGGKFLMGSPADEVGHRADEGPQVEVTVDPMWVAKTEVTWAQYQEFMNLYDTLKKFQQQGIRPAGDNLADAVTAPTPLYDASYTFEYGDDPEQPAVTMSQYSAQQYTKWLSRLTGLQFRLPTEAEWEYAARAGTSARFYFGDSADDIDDHAWFFDNADDGAGLVAQKQSNAFGLHDMLGNAAEWTMNQYTEDGYQKWAGKPINATEMIVFPTNDSSCVVRGGSWEMETEELRLSRRLVSDYALWKDIDPMIPKSPWWITDDPARGIGFRVYQSYRPLNKKTINQFWETSAEETQFEVKFKIEEGRGVRGIVDQSLPAATQAIQ